MLMNERLSYDDTGMSASVLPILEQPRVFRGSLSQSTLFILGLLIGVYPRLLYFFGR